MQQRAIELIEACNVVNSMHSAFQRDVREVSSELKCLTQAYFKNMIVDVESDSNTANNNNNNNGGHVHTRRDGTKPRVHVILLDELLSWYVVEWLVDMFPCGNFIFDSNEQQLFDTDIHRDHINEKYLDAENKEQVNHLNKDPDMHELFPKGRATLSDGTVCGCKAGYSFLADLGVHKVGSEVQLTKSFMHGLFESFSNGYQEFQQGRRPPLKPKNNMQGGTRTRPGALAEAFRGQCEACIEGEWVFIIR